MARKDEALNLLTDGKSPARIAKEMQISLRTVFGYLNQQIGAKKLTHTRVFYSIPVAARTAIRSVSRPLKGKRLQMTSSAILQRLKRDPQGLLNADIWSTSNPEQDIDTYINYCDERIFQTETFAELARLESNLHRYIFDNLKRKDDPGRRDWRILVPLEIRKACWARLEEHLQASQHSSGLEWFHFTTMIELKKILDKNKSLLNDLHSTLPKHVRGKPKNIMMLLDKVNQIRNIIMHPTKPIMLSESEHNLISELNRVFGY